MILTICPACAAPLAHTAPRCVRCKLRYCNATCQHDHWRRGHKQMCKKIHRGGNAEQYNADKKYKEAVAVAVEACAEDVKGQTCYICMEGNTKEGLVRGCACGDRESVASGNTGVAHLSCLAEQAKILVAEVEENNLGDKAFKDATAEELTEVASILENALKIAQRVMGREHPRTGNIRHELATAREEIARRRGA